MTEYSWWVGGQIGYLDTGDGRVAYRYWDEARQAPRTLLGIHGLGGNSENYIALGEALQPEVAVYAIDLAGNGESGTPGDVAGHTVHWRNLDALSAFIRAQHPQARRYLAGYSLGAAYAPAWVARNGRAVSGLILFAPPYRNVFKLPPHVAIAFQVLTRLMPRRYIRVVARSNQRIEPRYLFEMSSDKFIRARTLRALKASADIVPIGERALPHVTLPTLIVHGDADAVAKPDGARLAYARLGAADKTLAWIPGAQHDLYDVLSGVKNNAVSDEQRAQVIGVVREWLERH
ncbi:MAG TPA: alpha/beta fold hydrolase [Anaerolineae bacterium]|nr:alpha/beta fold hydrolase [Anaerolineae bacterium]